MLLPTDGAQLTDVAIRAMEAGIVVVNVDREFSSPFAARATAIALTPSRMPPPLASCHADHQWRGSTSVPSGWPARPVRTTSPVTASQTTTLHDWVEESTPATSGRSVWLSVGTPRR